MKTHLSLEKINKYFGDFHALSEINLTVNEGEFVCLLGPSGCGKTTLLRIIAGFETPSSGHIFLKEQKINTLPPHKRDFGMVFQSLALFPHMTVAENISYGMKRKHIAKSKQSARVAELLEMVQLPDIGQRQVTELSGGQQQRVAIARALAVPPKLFLLDEPLSALDAQIRENMQIELRQIQQRFGVTTILVTHDQHEAMMLADRLVVLKDGKVQQVDTPSNMYQRPGNEFVAEFLGSANLLSGVVRDNNVVDLLGQPVELTTQLPSGKTFNLAARSENITPQKFNINKHGSTLSGEVIFIRDLGAKVEILVRSKETTIRCHTSHERASNLQTGEHVALMFDMARCTIFNT